MKKFTFKDDVRKVGDLIPDPDNPRINDDAVPALVEGIKKVGFVNPIVIDKDNHVLAGHTRLKAAIELGMEEVPVRIATNYTKAEKIAFSLMDNKISELSGWDMPKLDIKLKELDLLDTSKVFDMSEFGFDVDDINSYDDFAKPSEKAEDYEEGEIIDMGDVQSSPGNKVLVMLDTAEDAEALANRLMSEGYECKVV